MGKLPWHPHGAEQHLEGKTKALMVMETLAAAQSPARECILLGLHPSLQHSGMNHKEMPPQGTNWSFFERADGSWTSDGSRERGCIQLAAFSAALQQHASEAGHALLPPQQKNHFSVFLVP